MRDYLDILKDISKYMADNGLVDDLMDLHESQKDYTDEDAFCSGTATWLYTFQAYTSCDDAVLFDLIDEFASYCNGKGIRFI